MKKFILIALIMLLTLGMVSGAETTISDTTSYLNGTTTIPNLNGTNVVSNLNYNQNNITNLTAFMFDGGQSITWNPTEYTLNIPSGLGNTLQVGQEMTLIGKNVDSVPLLNGQVIALVGSSGDRGTIIRADASNMSLAIRLAVVTIDSCAVNAECPVTFIGRINDVDTSAWSPGTLLYLSADGSGNLTSTPPAFPNYRVTIGAVIRQHANAGIILVKPQIDYTDGVVLNSLSVINNVTTTGNFVGSLVGDVLINNLSGSYNSLQDLVTLTTSAGKISGFTISDNGDGSINVSSGSGFIRSSDDPTAPLYFFEIADTNNLVLTDDAENYIYVDYNSGTPIIAKVVGGSTIRNNENDKFEVAEIFRDGTSLHVINHAQRGSDAMRLMQQRIYEINRVERSSAEGGLILSELGTRNLALTAGSVWIKLDKSSISAKDTSGSDTFSFYYGNGIGGFTETTGNTQWDNANYDGGAGALVAYTNNRYGFQDVYIESDGDLIVVYADDQYLTLAGAEDAGRVSIPESLEEHGLYVGRIAFQEGDATATILSPFTGFSPTGTAVTDHGLLAGLGDNDHTQYLLKAGDTTTGDQVFTGAFSSTGAFSASIDASNITSGTIAVARLPDLSSLYLPISGGTLSGSLSYGDHTVTISSGSISSDYGVMFIDGEGSVSDDLDCITGGSTGEILYLLPVGSSADITFKNDNCGTSENRLNMFMNSDYTPTTKTAMVRCVYGQSATGWVCDGIDSSTGNILFSGKLTIDQDVDDIALDIDSEATTLQSARIAGVGSGETLLVRKEVGGTGKVILVDMNGDGQGIQIDSEATTIGNEALEVITGQGADALRVAYGVKNSGQFVIGRDPNVSANLASVWYYRNLDSSATDTDLIYIEQDHAGDDSTALTVQNDGTGYGFLVQQNGAKEGIYVDQFGAGRGVSVEQHNSAVGAMRVLSNDGAFTGTDVQALFSASIDTGISTGTVIYAEQDSSSATGYVLHLKNDGTGNNLFIDQNGDAKSIQIDTESITQSGISILADAPRTGTTTTSAMSVRLDSGTATGDAYYGINDGTGKVMDLVSTNANAPKAVSIVTAGTSSSHVGLFVDNNVATTNTDEGLVWIRMNNAGASGNAFLVTNDGTGYGQRITQNGNQVALFIDQNAGNKGVLIQADGTSSSNYGIDIQMTSPLASAGRFWHGSDDYVELGRANSASTGSNFFFRNLNGTDVSGGILTIEQDNDYDIQNVFKIQSDGDPALGAIYLINTNGGRGYKSTTNVAEPNVQMEVEIGGSATSGNYGFLLDYNGDRDSNKYAMFIDDEDANGRVSMRLDFQSGDGLAIDNNGNTGASLTLLANGGGVEMRSPDGTVYCFTIANGGALTSTAGACTY